jgi:hypothetical protein
MFRHAISYPLAVLLTCTFATPFAFAQTPEEVKLKQKIVAWGTNKNVAVKLKSGSKVNGRIADIKDENFVVQLVENNQVVTRDIRYNEVKSITSKDANGGGKIAGWIVIGALAALGTIVLIGLALAD